MSLPALTQPPKWRIIASFAAVYVIWGSSYLGIRVALETLPPLFVAAMRLTIAGSLLILIARGSGAAKPTRQHWRSASVLGFLMFFIASGCIVLGQLLIPSGIAATLYAMVPLWFALLNWLMLDGERPGGRTVIGLVVGMAGVVLLVGPTGGDGINPIGAGLILISGASWAVGSLLSKRMATPASPALGAGMNLLMGGLMLLVVSIVTGEWAALDPAVISLRSVLAVGYLVIGPSIIGFSSYMWLLANVPPNQLAPYAYVNPVIAVFLGWALVGEVLTPRTLFASAVIIAAVVLITTARQRIRVAKPKPQPMPEPAYAENAAIGR